MLDVLEKILSDHGGLAAFFTLIVLKIAEWIFNYFKTKNEVTETAIRDLKVAHDRNTAQLIAAQVEMKKLRTDLRHAFFALKELAGKAWPNIAEQIEDYNRRERGQG